MSTLKVTNIQATGETASRAVSGVAAFRIHHSGDTPVINESDNASSITDNAVGDCTYSFTNSFNSGYFSTVSTSTEDGTIGYVGMYYDRDYTRNGANVRVQGIDHLDGYEDGAYTSTVAFGDLA